MSLHWRPFLLVKVQEANDDLGVVNHPKYLSFMYFCINFFLPLRRWLCKRLKNFIDSVGHCILPKCQLVAAIALQLLLLTGTYRFLWVLIDSCRFSSRLIDTYGYFLPIIGTYRYLWVFIVAYGYFSILMGIYCYLWVLIDTYSYLWVFIDSSGYLSFLLGFPLILVDTHRKFFEIFCTFWYFIVLMELSVVLLLFVLVVLLAVSGTF